MESNTSNTALLIMDVQAGIVGMLPDGQSLLASTAKAIAHARAKKIPVIYVVVGFRQGAPEISMNNKGFSAFKERLAGVNMDDFMKVHPDVAPAAGEVTVIKRRVCAFSGSDLQVVLSAFGISHLVLTGISSTTREAADKDYRITILADCCADRDEEVHRVLTTKVFPHQADVLTSAEWIA
jgi:nicotinamidase-related amidase